MAGRLVWDAVGEKFYEIGVNRGVLYPQANGLYPKGVAWNGLTGVTESPTGAEPTELYADNIMYAALRSAEKFGATIEAYTYPPEFSACNGETEIAPGLTIGQQARIPFGFCYTTQVGSDANVDGKEDYKIHLVYGATASPSERSYTTINESPDAITFSWEVTATPVPVTGFKPTATLVIDTRNVAAEKLEALENVLYGSGSNEARMPLPDEVAALIA